MNTCLERLFEKYNISQKNRYEIFQIYKLLSLPKRKKLVENFESLVWKIAYIERQLEEERKILIPEAVNNVREVLDEIKNERKISQ